MVECEMATRDGTVRREMKNVRWKGLSIIRHKS
jgi:hypothetical protein